MINSQSKGFQRSQPKIRIQGPGTRTGWWLTPWFWRHRVAHVQLPCQPMIWALVCGGSFLPLQLQVKVFLTDILEIFFARVCQPVFSLYVPSKLERNMCLLSMQGDMVWVCDLCYTALNTFHMNVKPIGKVLMCYWEWCAAQSSKSSSVNHKDNGDWQSRAKQVSPSIGPMMPAWPWWYHICWYHIWIHIWW